MSMERQLDEMLHATKMMELEHQRHKLQKFGRTFRKVASILATVVVFMIGAQIIVMIETVTSPPMCRMP